MNKGHAHAATEPGSAHAAASVRVLVVAQAPLVAVIRPVLQEAQVTLLCVESLAAAPDAVSTFRPEAVLLDAHFVAGPADEPFKAIRAVHPCACALVAPAPSGDMVTLADRVGADTLLVQPLEMVVLRRFLQREARRPVARPKDWFPLPNVAGSSAQMQDVWHLILLAAQSDTSVVLNGETGAGKEVLARALHRFSWRRAGPFTAVNCAAIPEHLLESELFGHEKGAFTGAIAQHKGCFEKAHGGTLFLDEIGDLGLALQGKLLRVLQERCFQRVGGTETVTVDVRIVVATHRNLEEEVQQGRFRQDLFYRLNVLCVRAPPLRERRGDILGLWNNMLAEAAAAEMRPLPQTSPEVQRRLLAHDWPGNIRELHNVMEHVFTVATGATITTADLPAGLNQVTVRRPTPGSLAGYTMKELERAAILEAYQAVGSASETARMLGISLRKVHYRLKAYLHPAADGTTVTAPPREDAAVSPGRADGCTGSDIESAHPGPGTGA